MNRLKKHAPLLIVVAIAIAVVLMVWSRKVAAVDATASLHIPAGEVLPGLTTSPQR